MPSSRAKFAAASSPSLLAAANFAHRLWARQTACWLGLHHRCECTPAAMLGLCCPPYVIRAECAFLLATSAPQIAADNMGRGAPAAQDRRGRWHAGRPQLRRHMRHRRSCRCGCVLPALAGCCVRLTHCSMRCGCRWSTSGPQGRLVHRRCRQKRFPLQQLLRPCIVPIRQMLHGFRLHALEITAILPVRPYSHIEIQSRPVPVGGRTSVGPKGRLLRQQCNSQLCLQLGLERPPAHEVGIYGLGSAAHLSRPPLMRQSGCSTVALGIGWLQRRHTCKRGPEGNDKNLQVKGGKRNT